MADITFPQAVDASTGRWTCPRRFGRKLEAGRHEIVFESGGEAVAIRLALAPTDASFL